MTYVIRVGKTKVYVGVPPTGTEVLIIRAYDDNSFREGADCLDGLEGKVTVNDIPRSDFDKVWLAGQRVHTAAKGLKAAEIDLSIAQGQ